MEGSYIFETVEFKWKLLHLRNWTWWSIKLIIYHASRPLFPRTKVSPDLIVFAFQYLPEPVSLHNKSPRTIFCLLKNLPNLSNKLCLSRSNFCTWNTPNPIPASVLIVRLTRAHRLLNCQPNIAESNSVIDPKAILTLHYHQY